jgi:drug/metabolite transporter (DMT)-like permease
MKLFWLTAFAMAAFAANSVLTRVALTQGADPFAFAALRVISGAIILVGLVSLRTGFPRFTVRKHLPSSTALIVYMLGFSIAYLSVPSGIGALILFGSVQMTMVTGALLSKEAMPPQRWVGGAVSLGGLVFLLWPSTSFTLSWGAVFAMIAAGVGWGIYSLIGRGAKDPLTETAVNFALAIVPTAAVWMVLQGGISVEGAILALIAGGLTSGLGYALWYGILPQLGASRASISQLTVPLLATLGGFAVLNEDITLKFGVASLLVLGGIGISLLRQPQKR